ncbi:MAG: long-chain fatty acid--CoA ligase [Euryarchaeota archaeon RBG_16_68_13]|nr:MAG: long-chain fatty acid--CoA ligase [Euryarchaeota archaeon RBG_16_68_13]
MEKPWHRHWPDGVPRTIEVPDIPLHELLRRAAREHGSRPAISFYNTSMSFGELDDAADRFAAGLRRIGVQPGERVSLVLPNTPHFFVAFFGVLRVGGIVVQTNPLYTARELEQLYNDAGVETVVALDIFWHNVGKAKQGTEVKRVVVADVADYLGAPLRQLYPIKKKKDLKKQGHWPLTIPEAPWVHRFRALLETPPEAGREPIVRAAEDVAVLQYTGGTTGTPKGAMLTHRNLVANALQTAAWLPMKGTVQERFLGAIPLFHVYGLTTLLLASVVLGAEVVLYPNPREIGHILKLIGKTKPTIFPGVPTMYIAILRHPKVGKYDLRSVKVCISGAAPLPNEIRHEWEKVTGGKIVEGYGLTEASPVTHANPLQGLVKEGIGLPFPDTEARIVDADDPSREMPQGEAGELAIRGPQVMKGYWNKPTETAAVLRDDWLLTGDIAKMDEDGYFFIVDRKKDIILCSGYNVYPREVEEVLFMHPSVAEAAAIGVPDPYRGETVKAFLVLKPGMTATEEEIIAFCKERLAPFKIPKQVEFVTDLPKSLVGKVLRRELRERELAKAHSAAKA